MKIAILSLLQDIDPGYAVATVTLSHIRMLKEQGHEVLLLTSEDSILKEEDVGCEVRCELPVWQLHDYVSRETIKEDDNDKVTKIKEVIEKYSDYILIEHDFILQGWYYPHGLATTYFDDVWHVIHSKVSDSTPVNKLPKSHKIIVLDESLIEATEKHYEASNRVFCIPNPVDILEFNAVEEETRRMVKEWDLLDYDYIFTYPFCATRWTAKGADFFAIFTKYMENQGLKVAGVFLMSHANEGFKKPNWDTCHFSNIMFKEYEFGVSKKVVRDFMWLSDGFLLPSHSETSSLVYKEAALAKNPVILNRLLKLNSKAPTANLMRISDDNYELVLQQFLKESEHLEDFRFIRKNLNEKAVGKKLSNLLKQYA